MTARQFHLNASLMGVGHHEAAWRHPRTEAHRVLEVAHCQELGRIAERGPLNSPRSPQGRPLLVQGRVVGDDPGSGGRGASTATCWSRSWRRTSGSPCGSSSASSAAGAGTAPSPGSPSRSPTTCRAGSRTAPPDGFNIMPSYLPGGLEDFVGQVVPICSGAASSATSTPPTRCAATTDSSRWRAASPATAPKQAHEPRAPILDLRGKGDPMTDPIDVPRRGCRPARPRSASLLPE